MISFSQVEKSFTQSFNSCVLASYSIVANYFTGIPIHSFFSAYCRQYNKANDQRQAEDVYSEHFNSLIKVPGQNGYRIILNLHKNSSEPEFLQARSLFSFEFFEVASSAFERIEATLLKEPAFLNLTIGDTIISGSIMDPVHDLCCHSVTIFHDGDSLCTRDTARHLGQNIFRVPSLSVYGQTRDAVLYRKV